MQMPKGYNEAQVLGEYKPLPPGGYICQIMQVEEQISRGGKNMVVISLDIYEGVQKGYYAKQYRADTRKDKKWGCRVFQLVENSDGFASAGFKTFVNAVEKSNPSFQVQWGDGFCDCFRHCFVGALFGKEEYEKRTGGTAWSTKCQGFRPVEVIRNGEYETPQDKPLKQPEYPPVGSDGFMNIPDGIDSELPFA